MSKQYFTGRWIIGLSLLIALSAASAAWSQTALERLEQQIRQRVGQEPQPPPPQPGVSSPTPAVAGNEPVAADNREPGYLGLLADDRQDRGRGVRVLEVHADSPAAKGGLKKQDLITSVAGVRTRQMSEMSDVLNLYVAGESIEFEVLRDNKPQKVKVVLGLRPPQKNAGGQVSEAIPLPPGEVIAPDAVAPPVLLPPRPAAADDHPTVEQLQKRIEELERRVTELEKALGETRKK